MAKISKEVIEALHKQNVNLEEILRSVLLLPPLAPDDSWTVKGVTFPAGTYFRTWYKDRPWWGIVKDGALWVKDRRFTTPSAATEMFVQPAINGWRYWECRMPGSSSWVCIGDLRKEPLND